jgi:hypothetical protein
MNSVDFKGLFYIFGAGLGGLLMLCTATPFLTVLAFRWYPVLWPWIFVPVVFGIVVGFLFAVLSQHLLPMPSA